MMRRLLLMLPFVVFLGLAFFLYRGLSLDPSARESALIGQAFPAFTLPTLEDPDTEVDESLLRGQVSLVNVWASWCPTCKEEMPQLLALSERGIQMAATIKTPVTWGDSFLKSLENLSRSTSSILPATWVSSLACMACPKPSWSTQTVSFDTSTSGT